jgi:hypothetical protein
MASFGHLQMLLFIISEPTLNWQKYYRPLLTLKLFCRCILKAFASAMSVSGGLVVFHQFFHSSGITRLAGFE